MSTKQPEKRSSAAAQALLAGLLQGLGERDKDEAQAQAGERLAEQTLRPSTLPTLRADRH
jgi:hypothetical protein